MRTGSLQDYTSTELEASLRRARLNVDRKTASREAAVRRLRLLEIEHHRRRSFGIVEDDDTEMERARKRARSAHHQAQMWASIERGSP